MYFYKDLFSPQGCRPIGKVSCKWKEICKGGLNFDSHPNLLVIHSYGMHGPPGVIVVADGYQPWVTRVREP